MECKSMTKWLARLKQVITSTPLRSLLLPFCILVMLFLVDMIWDSSEQISYLHFITDGLIIGSFVYLVINVWQRYRNDAALHHQTVTKLSQSNRKIKTQSQQIEKLREGITQHIQQVFQDWKLTQAERDIALLIIKGYSLDEIAQFRHKSERTVRDQAATIYRKAKVKNRVELTAYFIEDLIHLDQPDQSSAA